MTRTYRVWYFLALLLALVPATSRLLMWQKARARLLDPAMIEAGEVLFSHDWKPNDPLCPSGDGLGPVYNATSCVACHHQGGAGGGGGLEHNVTTFTVHIKGQPAREGVVHARHVNGDQHRETLKHLHPDLPALSQPTLADLVGIGSPEPFVVHLSQRNTPALFGAKLIDDIPERIILAGAKNQRLKWGMASPEDESVPVGRGPRLANGRLGRFGWKGQMASLSDFVQAACADELGLGNPGQVQPTPLYATGASRSSSIDLTIHQCDQLTSFCASLPRPVERLPEGGSAEQATLGKKLFRTIGCADCHTPKLGSVDGIYSDLLLHRMGQDLVGGGSYGAPPIPVPDAPKEGPVPSEWRTPPLWGVADSAPYLHDGRAPTLEKAIEMHGGQGKRAAQNFKSLRGEDQAQLIAFLMTLRAP